MISKITKRDSVYSFMLKKEFAEGEKKIINILDDYFAVNDKLEKWEWEVLKMSILGSIKRVNVAIDDVD